MSELETENRVIKLQMRVEKGEDSGKLMAFGDSHIGNRHHDRMC